MIEILFRGKRLDDGEWIEGYLAYENIIKMIRKCFDWRGDYVCNSLEEYKVDPETVGQFTGITDRNGKKIFEGDIIRCEAYDHEFEDEYLSNNKITVRFGDGYFYPFHLNGAWRGGVENIEVIGNIHDNPELLEVE